MECFCKRAALYSELSSSVINERDQSQVESYRMIWYGIVLSVVFFDSLSHFAFVLVYLSIFHNFSSSSLYSETLFRIHSCCNLTRTHQQIRQQRNVVNRAEREQRIHDLSLKHFFSFTVYTTTIKLCSKLSQQMI